MKGKAFIVVGHKHWGKSYTLRSLTRGIHQIRDIEIDGIKLVIRRMSNDDPPADSLVKFVINLDQSSDTHIIITLCPDFESELTITILNALKKKYELFFWVMKYNYVGDRPVARKEIAEKQIERLRGLGKVEVVTTKDVEKDERARQFRRFIKKWL